MKNIYFIGINGIGMSGLAKIMAIKGYNVSGADLNRSKRIDELENLGVKVFPEHNEINIEGADLVVRSSAIKESNPEYKKALEVGIKVIKRGELLAFLMNREKGVAIAGTHGKTTTSSMLGAVSLSIDPTIVVGGILPEIDSNAKAGTNDYFIAEADESDNSFLYLHPYYSVITNIEEDHMENHGSFKNIEESFIRFMDQTKEEIIANVDCENVVNIIKDNDKVITYSMKSESAHIYAKNIRIESFKTFYDVYIDKEYVGEFSLGIPGLHNVSNSLPVIYLALKFGVDKEELSDKLLKFRGAKRRFDILYDKDIKIVDDYAHHPTEIKATLQAVRERTDEKVVAIFQPHRFSRIKFLWDRFEGVFDKADEVILLPTYSAGEENIYGIVPEEFAKFIAPKGNIKLAQDEKDLYETIEKQEKDTLYLFMGAGDISKMAHNITELLEKN